MLFNNCILSLPIAQARQNGKIRVMAEEWITSKEAVELSGYHPDHLSRLVRSETGLNLRALAAQTRLHLAQRLLREHALVRVVAEAAGFPDQNYFARWFKKQTGQSPMAWRGTRVEKA